MDEGLSTDNGDLRERAFKFEKINATLGKVEYIVDGNNYGTVTSISGCDRSTVSVRRPLQYIEYEMLSQITRTFHSNNQTRREPSFSDSTEEDAPKPLQCTYRVGWQDGPDAHTVAMGCNHQGAAPVCYDDGEMLMVFYSCLDQSNCPWADLAESSPPKQATTEKEGTQDACSSLNTCAGEYSSDIAGLNIWFFHNNPYHFLSIFRLQPKQSLAGVGDYSKATTRLMEPPVLL